MAESRGGYYPPEAEEFPDEVGLAKPEGQGGSVQESGVLAEGGGFSPIEVSTEGLDAESGVNGSEAEPKEWTSQEIVQAILEFVKQLAEYDKQARRQAEERLSLVEEEALKQAELEEVERQELEQRVEGEIEAHGLREGAVWYELEVGRLRLQGALEFILERKPEIAGSIIQRSLAVLNPPQDDDIVEQA